MERAKFIAHRGTRIFQIDFSGLTSTEDLLRVMDEARSSIAAEPQGSVLTLTNVEGTPINREVVSGVLAMVKHNKPYVRAAAAVGVQRAHAVVLQTVQMFSQRKVEVMESRSAALEWLAAHAAPSLELQEAAVPAAHDR